MALTILVKVIMLRLVYVQPGIEGKLMAVANLVNKLWHFLACLAAEIFIYFFQLLIRALRIIWKVRIVGACHVEMNFFPFRSI